MHNVYTLWLSEFMLQCLISIRPQRIRPRQAFSHPDEIWGVSPSPADPSLLLTCSNATGGGGSDGSSEFKVFPLLLADPCGSN